MSGILCEHGEVKVLSSSLTITPFIFPISLDRMCLRRWCLEVLVLWFHEQQVACIGCILFAHIIQ